MITVDGVNFSTREVSTVYEFVRDYHSDDKYDLNDFYYRMINITLSYGMNSSSRWESRMDVSSTCILPETNIEDLNLNFTLTMRKVKKKEKLEYLNSLLGVSEDKKIKKLIRRKIKYVSRSRGSLNSKHGNRRNHPEDNLAMLWITNYNREEMLMISGIPVVEMNLSAPWKIAYKERITRRESTEEEKIIYDTLRKFMTEKFHPPGDKKEFCKYLEINKPYLTVGSSFLVRRNMRRLIERIITVGTPEQLICLKNIFSSRFDSLFTGMNLWDLIRKSTNLRTCSALISSLLPIDKKKASIIYSVIRGHKNEDDYTINNEVENLISIFVISGDHEKMLWNVEKLTLSHLYLAFKHPNKKVFKTIIQNLNLGNCRSENLTSPMYNHGAVGSQRPSRSDTPAPITYPFFPDWRYINILCKYDVITQSLIKKYMRAFPEKEHLSPQHYESHIRKILHLYPNVRIMLLSSLEKSPETEKYLDFTLNMTKDVEIHSYVHLISLYPELVRKYISVISPTLLLGLSGRRWVENLVILLEDGYKDGIVFIRSLEDPIRDLIVTPHSRIIDLIREDSIIFYKFCARVSHLDPLWLKGVDPLLREDIVRERIKEALPIPRDMQMQNFSYIIESVCLSPHSRESISLLLSILPAEKVNDVAVLLYRLDSDSFRVARKDPRFVMDSFLLRIRDCQDNVRPWLYRYQ